MAKSAMILAAGLGLRMRPLTNLLPKPLISVAGKTMLERTFEHLKSIQISKIVVNTHYLAPMVKQKSKEFYPNTLFSHEEVLLETGGGIKKALPLLGNKPFFTLNGDSIWSGSQSLINMEHIWNETAMDVLLLLIAREKAHGYEGRGDFFISSDGRLSRRDNRAEAPYVYIGVQLVSPQLFQNAPEGPFSMNLLWDEALKKNRLYGHIHSGEWFHMSSAEDLKRYEPFVDKLSSPFDYRIDPKGVSALLWK